MVSFRSHLLFLGLTRIRGLVSVYLATRGAYRDGVLTEEGAEIFYLWTSFENMLRDIAHLDQAELESIVLWNRLLVYATLFGYAKKVSKLMKVRHIQLENPDLNLYVAYGWHHSSTPQLHKSSNIQLSQIQLAITLYLLEVVLQVEDSQEAGGGGSIGAF